MLLFTQNKYLLSECISALQKCIRRGMLEESVFWATEIETKYPKYLWLRLVVIVNEDIGLAAPEVIQLVEALRAQYWFLRENAKGSPERMALVNAVVAMCRAKKTRLADDLVIVVNCRRDFENWRLEIPDFALDKHTARGKKKGRGWDHWEKEGMTIVNEAEGLNPYRDEALRMLNLYDKPNPVNKLKKDVANPDTETEENWDLFETNGATE